MKHFSPVFVFLFHFLLNRCWWIFEFQECEFEISQKGELVAKLENKTKEISQMLNNLNTMSQNDRSENGDTSQNKTTAEKGEKWLYQWYQLVAKSERKSPYFIFLLMSHSWHNLAGNSKLLSKHAKQISNSISIWQTNLSFLSSTYFFLICCLAKFIKGVLTNHHCKNIKSMTMIYSWCLILGKYGYLFIFSLDILFC